jgi:lipid-A-disaccharide synthase-like uncharacterized protein
MMYDPSYISAAGRIMLAVMLAAVLYLLWGFAGALLSAMRWVWEWLCEKVGI